MPVYKCFFFRDSLINIKFSWLSLFLTICNTATIFKACNDYKMYVLVRQGLSDLDYIFMAHGLMLNVPD